MKNGKIITVAAALVPENATNVKHVFSAYPKDFNIKSNKKWFSREDLDRMFAKVVVIIETTYEVDGVVYVDRDILRGD